MGLVHGRTHGAEQGSREWRAVVCCILRGNAPSRNRVSHRAVHAAAVHRTPRALGKHLGEGISRAIALGFRFALIAEGDDSGASGCHRQEYGRSEPHQGAPHDPPRLLCLALLRRFFLRECLCPLSLGSGYLLQLLAFRILTSCLSLFARPDELVMERGRLGRVLWATSGPGLGRGDTVIEEQSACGPPRGLPLARALQQPRV